MIPFMAEEIYLNLVKSIDGQAPESVHLCDFPVVEEAMIDKKLEEDMDEVLKIVVMGRAARNTANIKNRQPIGRMFVKADHVLSDYYVTIIEDELNVKQVSFTDDVREFTSYTFKPQLKTVGPKYGKQLNNIRGALSQIDGSQAMDTLNESGALTFRFGETEVVLTKDDLLIDVAQKDGFVTEEDNYVTVVLDTNLTQELIEEGFVREIISKIQTMRKESGFEVTDHIRVYLADDSEKVSGILKKNLEEIGNEVLADEVRLGADSILQAQAAAGEKPVFAKEWNINGENVTLGVTKA